MPRCIVGMGRELFGGPMREGQAHTTSVLTAGLGGILPMCMCAFCSVGLEWYRYGDENC